SLASVVPWNWENFDEYLTAIDHGLGLNLMPLVGHNPLRLSAMDAAAWDRAATPDEIAHMQRLLRESMEAGAWGWSTTDSPTHAGPQGPACADAPGGRRGAGSAGRDGRRVQSGDHRDPAKGRRQAEPRRPRSPARRGRGERAARVLPELQHQRLAVRREGLARGRAA